MSAGIEGAELCLCTLVKVLTVNLLHIDTIQAFLTQSAADHIQQPSSPPQCQGGSNTKHSGSCHAELLTRNDKIPDVLLKHLTKELVVHITGDGRQVSIK